MKTCNKCNESKENTEFFRDKNSRDGFYSICKKCKQDATYKWRETNKQKYNDGAKKWRENNKNKEYGHEIKRRYGITLAEYNEMLLQQNYKCAICDKQHDDSVKRSRLYVDHCHQSNKIRQLLCAFCNSALGYFRDDVNLMQKAITYVNKHK